MKPDRLENNLLQASRLAKAGDESQCRPVLIPRNGNNALMAALLAVTLIVYWPSLWGGFLNWDDNHNVVFNEQIRTLSGDTLKWAWTDVGPDLRYKPLGWLTWAAIVAVFGLDPFGFHLVNLGLHLMNTALVFLLIRRLCRLSGRGGHKEDGRHLAAFAGVGALLWAWHPMRVEPVAWISCLPHHLSLAFVLGATLVYLGLDFSGSVWRQGRFWAATGLYMGALSAFPLALGYPAVWLALNIFPLRRVKVELTGQLFRGDALRAWLEVGTVFAVAVLFLGLQLWFRHMGEGHFTPPASLEEFPLTERVMQGVYVWVFYFWRLFFPAHLSPVYLDLFPVDPLGFRFVFSAVVFVVLLVVIWRRRGESPGAVAGVIAHVGILVPVIGVTEKPHFPGDRYALINGIVLTVTLVVWCWQRVRPENRRTLGLSAGLCLVIMVARVESYLPVWRDDVTMFQTQARQLPVPNRHPAMERLALALASRGEHREAEFWYQLRCRGLEPEALPFELAFMRGLNREKLNDPAGAARFYRAALNASPGRYFVMYPLGRVLFRLGDHAEGTNWFEAARLVAKGEAEIDLEYGRALREAGFFDKAIRVLHEGLSRPALPENVRTALMEELDRIPADRRSRP